MKDQTVQAQETGEPPASLLASTWLVVPLYNEAPVVRETICAARAVFPHVVVVDDGSTDDSAAEAAATGAIQGANESGAKVTVVGFDSGKTQIEAIKAGTQAGAVTQSPVKIGYETVKAAILAVNGKDLPKTIDSGFAWYDKTNIDDPSIKPNLYE